ncbi:YwiC-like family protein [Nodosilinea sp. LEGE 07088]|uniref:YwiC-like family protein n=1 Tax=Nodosilinea sp. LEGE 07088 TaxID=2777968 RepID=UPI00187EE69F|nr:YwiC-like family protein [Nodosilinea sp. LEGE 07088]MBE9139493.1 YwiC-like family protein [Nodosilinea sp. LEGE 07088]
MTTNLLQTPSSQAWHRPVISPEHGAYVVLGLSFLVGAAAAQQWTWATTLALACAVCGFQAEHPLMLQIKQRKSWKPRFLVWGGLYGGVAIAAAVALYGWQGGGWSPLLAIYGAAALALVIDAIAVYRRGQKSIVNELITFAALCLAAPLAYVATTGILTPMTGGLWALCSLYFCSTIFTVKLRKPAKGETAEAPLKRAIAYHGLALLLVASLYGLGLLPLVPTLAFGVALVKLLGISLGLDWFRTTRIGPVAAIETVTALLFGAIVIVALLPVHGGMV